MWVPTICWCCLIFFFNWILFQQLKAIIYLNSKHFENLFDVLFFFELWEVLEGPIRGVKKAYIKIQLHPCVSEILILLIYISLEPLFHWTQRSEFNCCLISVTSQSINWKIANKGFWGFFSCTWFVMTYLKISPKMHEEGYISWVRLLLGF